MGRIFVFYGPSASGKTEVQKHLTNAQFPRIITATTRAPRENEADGIHYLFIDKQRFIELIEKKELVEYTNYNGEYYGTLRSSIEEILAGSGKANIIMDLSGVLALKKMYGDHITAIYIGASLESLERRLTARGSDADEIAGRLRKAQVEELTDRYLEAADAVVWNNDGTDFGVTLSKVRAYIL
ncbi:guanylate kinase [Paenibacillus sp. BR2-3]|uniref:guanylate kinase n=1 Tax=Paenibacillus sp. BR2-3 TaxID=3048494 RepID=UPI003977D5C7